MLPAQLVDVLLQEDNRQPDSWDANPRKGQGSSGADDSSGAINSSSGGSAVSSLSPSPEILVSTWDLKHRLSDAFLSECTIEICKDPAPINKKEIPKLNFEVQITPIYKVLQKKEKTATEEEGGGGGGEVHDILSEVEAVYSEVESDCQPDDVEDDADDVATSVAAFTSLDDQLTTANRTQYRPTFRCEHCPNAYGNRGALWQHSVAAHSPHKNCQCAICGRKFYRNCSLALHLKSHHNDAKQQQQQPDSQCHDDMDHDTTVGGPSDAYLTTQHHNRSKSGGGSPGSSDRQLQSCAVSSAGSRPYQCQYCKKCYSQKSVLKKHLVIHTGERLTCALCGIDFTQKSSLLRHVKRMHSANAATTAAIASSARPTHKHQRHHHPPILPTDTDSLPSVQTFMRNIKIPQGISISMVD